MQFTEEKKGDVIILRINGRIDAITSPQLEKKVLSIIDSGHHKLLMDFTNVEYLSSAGMRLLLSGTKKMQTVGGKLVISSVDQDVMDVIKMAGFNSILTLASSEDKALTEF